MTDTSPLRELRGHSRCVLYEMLTLEVPFLANSMGELIQMVTKDEPPQIDQKYSSGLRSVRPSSLASLLPPHLAAALCVRLCAYTNHPPFAVSEP